MNLRRRRQLLYHLQMRLRGVRWWVRVGAGRCRGCRRRRNNQLLLRRRCGVWRGRPLRCRRHRRLVCRRRRDPPLLCCHLACAQMDIQFTIIVRSYLAGTKMWRPALSFSRSSSNFTGCETFPQSFSTFFLQRQFSLFGLQNFGH